MKLSTIKWLSKTIALPLFIGILNIAPVSAEQIDRSRTSGTDSSPSVTDLNLMVPVTASPLPSDRSEQSDSIEPIWSGSPRTNPSLPITKKRTNRSKSAARSTGELATNTNSTPSLTGGKSTKSSSVNRYSKNVDPATGVTLKDSRKSRSRTEIAAVSPPPLSGNYLRLVRDATKGTNDLGNPIYTLEAYVRGERYQTFDAVSGTARSQTADRNRGNNSAPLPDGLYSVSSQVVPGTVYEVGRTFIGIFPKFDTRRVDLGIHLDRSFNQTNGYDGTAGCIGLTTGAERDAINEFVTKYQPRNLFVKIAPRGD
jgi:hypothetical protein